MGCVQSIHEPFRSKKILENIKDVEESTGLVREFQRAESMHFPLTEKIPVKVFSQNIYIDSSLRVHFIIKLQHEAFDKDPVQLYGSCYLSHYIIGMAGISTCHVIYSNGKSENYYRTVFRFARVNLKYDEIPMQFEMDFTCICKYPRSYLKIILSE
jgi:hypothetical protein